MSLPTSFTNPPGRRYGSVALCRDRDGAVLMLHPDHKAGLILPGGCAAAGEWPHDACVRITEEETGLRVMPEHLAAVDFIPANPDNGSAEGVNFVFDCGVFPTGTEVTLPEKGFRGYTWVPVGDLEALAPSYQARRIRQALSASAKGRTAYLVQGVPALPGVSRVGS
ncbi:NUDIX domain-containing protein [Streptomyces sp. URMC 125]|uniref:NUDIX domain-containing protein n=1 Tax=Streptomyces sp. URMC 125 TaxID=3423419 RepID=UPI003F1D1349